ncbi:MAG: 23S rRNA (uracil(1939)-C(5))-methyltransferase RlmD [Clostridiales bacterium]|nr:23S rRNA (uracil(1939)-C(5))-methyltransferase RlmD [Eubacteriales bacterium]MDH7566787.1 23S rRNA (uracil(1939)-C(5))-methyltransferase RlmD [Clostridiales bacterium]
MEIKKNEIYTLEITGMTHEGQGVGRIGSFAVFVDGTIPGETVEIKIIKKAKSYAVGKLISITKQSPHRVPPFCGSFPRCGGCHLQHMSYKAQLSFKTDLVRESIKRIGKLKDVQIHETLGMENAFYYRNKAQFPAGLYQGQPTLGFYASRSHDIVPSPACAIQHQVSDRVRNIVREYIVENGVSVYDETSREGLVRHVMTRVGYKTGEVMVVIVINGKDLPQKEKLVNMLISRVPSVKSIILNVNTKNTNIILGETNIKIFGSDTITDFIGRFKFTISPLSFFQVNPVQTEILYEKALEYADLKGNETVFDLYCGIGTISLFLSDRAKKVYGVESVEDAVEDAVKNKKLNQVENVEFIVGEAEKVIPEMHSRGVRADVVVVDPPRKGCDEGLLKTLVSMAPERIVYISCNPSTLARDLGYLVENGFRAVEVQPVDMFPHTYHVECVVSIKRKHSD